MSISSETENSPKGSSLIVNDQTWGRMKKVELIHRNSHNININDTFFMTSWDFYDNLSQMSWFIFMFFAVYPVVSHKILSIWFNTSTNKKNKIYLKNTQKIFSNVLNVLKKPSMVHVDLFLAKSPLNIALHGSLLWRLLSTRNNRLHQTCCKIPALHQMQV